MKLFAATVVLCMSIGSASAENSISWPPSWVQYGNLPATTTDFITQDAGNSVQQAIVLQANYIVPPGSSDRVISTPLVAISLELNKSKSIWEKALDMKYGGEPTPKVAK